MTPLRRRAVVFLIAALTQFMTLAAASMTHSDAIKHAQLSIPERPQQTIIAVRVVQKALSAPNQWAEHSAQLPSLYTQVTSKCEFQSRRAGLKALYAALTVVALEPLKLPTAALPKALLSPAEFCILKLLGYIC